MTDFFYKYQKYKYKYKIFRSTYFRSISHVKNKYNELSGGVDTDLSDGNEIKYDKCKPFEKCLDDCIKTTGSKDCLDACKKGDGSEVCLNLCKKDNNSDNCKQFKRINEIKKLDNNFDNTYTQINKINYEKIKTIKKINDKLQNNYYIYFFKYNDLLDNDMVKQIIDTYFNINNTDNLLLNKITIQKEEEKIKS